LLIKEELLEEKSIALQLKILVQEENPILVQDKNEPILGFNEKRSRKSLVMAESSLKAPIQKNSTLFSFF